MKYEDISQEQHLFIDLALQGENILVDACIGSGKTTAIQTLCGLMGADRRILYLTYNKLLKLDAKSKIKTRGTKTTVTNYHGFCYSELRRNGQQPNLSDCIQLYNQSNLPVRHYDVLILDEYQDIEQEIAEMLYHIKDANPGIQIIAVGDMAQKIYDKTRLNAAAFITDFLGAGKYRAIEFTQCFRLSPDLAQRLGTIWGKEIRGVNENCSVEYMTIHDAINTLAQYKPGEILCLGACVGSRNVIMNTLEREYPETFNKKTVWAKISEAEGGTSPDSECAVFTTFDGCKGMERDVCVVCDWTENYWETRISRSQVNSKIIRNIFCVAASRGKSRIIFLKTKDLLDDKTLTKVEGESSKFEDMQISHMFDFKFVEDIEDAYRQLEVSEITPKEEPINVPTKDGMIDLSVCVGIYQEVAYFDQCDITIYIEEYFNTHKDKDFLKREMREDWGLEDKVLFLTSLETEQNRYRTQVRLPLVPEDAWNQIADRLATFLPANATVQVGCEFPFGMNGNEEFLVSGFADVLKDETVIELKFVDELAHRHFLQCAMYMVSLKKNRGILWNVRTNQRYEIRIPDTKAFLDKVTVAATKGELTEYGLGSYEARTGKREAFDYSDIFSNFIIQNPSACETVFKQMERARRAKLPFGAISIKNAFASLGVEIPLIPKTFQRHWENYCAERRRERRRSRKKAVQNAVVGI